MKAGLFLVLITFLYAHPGMTQLQCRSFEYSGEQLRKQPGLSSSVSSIEKFIRQNIDVSAARIEGMVIKIPVVVHVLYHYPAEKISDELVHSQLAILNECFRKQNKDTSDIPEAFRSLAADCEIEFQLATSDPRKRNTSGIVKKYTPITKWVMDDKMKFSEEMGDDAWDPKSYLNIWVCNLDKFAGYSSVVGGPENVDGIVLGLAAFGSENKTAVHEAGHWLGLKHLWGDEYCGSDEVNDTPKQASYTLGCPANIRVTCGNGPHGDMYMNYMDFTSDKCTHLFTQGQKARMRSLFATGGPRYSFLSSAGLNPPLVFEIPVEEEDPKWLEPRVYPNPASQEITVDLNYDVRWIGKAIQVSNVQGQVLMSVTITAKLQKINVSKLAPGLYFLAAKKEDGVSMKQKFLKL